jgi:hypothetical protein
MTDGELIFIISLIIGIIVAVLFTYRKELSMTSYSGAIVLQEEKVDACGTVHKGMYYIEYNAYFLGFIKIRTKFTERARSYGDCFDMVIYESDVSSLIEKFNKRANAVIKQRRVKKVQDIPKNIKYGKN